MNNHHFITSSDDAQAPESNSRRGFLKASGVVGGSLVVGFSSLPTQLLAAPLAKPQPYVASGYITIGPDSKVFLTMPRVEMGQGIYTAMSMLVAEELEVDLDKVTLLHAPPDVKVYGAPIGDQLTGGSLSIRTHWQLMRSTGAIARTVLVQAAADGWKVPATACTAEHGAVMHKATGRRLAYGQLVSAASKLPVPTKFALKTPAEFKVIGKPMPRLDAKGKVDGSALYGIDAVLPGMKYAAVVQSPVFGGKLKSVDESKARALPGVRDVVKLDNAVAVIADNTYYARQGIAALDVVWDEGANSKLTTQELQGVMKAGLDRPGVVAREKGDPGKVLAADARKVEQVYFNQLLAHAPMEVMNCTVHVTQDGTEIWTGTQVPARAQAAVAKALGLPLEKVVLHGYLIGGAFGRRLYHDYVEQAALIGKQVKGPVKVTWSREEDTQHSMHRGVYAHRVSASIDAQGYPVALSHKISGPSNLAVLAPAFIKDGIDSDTVEGSANYPYDIANMRTEHTRVEGPIPSGFWRGVGPTRNVLVLESFMDELATRAGKDPLAFRLAMLKTDKRAHHVLSRASEMAGWGKPLPARSGRGIALMFAWDTYIAQVVDLKVSDTGDVSVQRVVCVVDCGIVVHPDGVLAQMQGGTTYGLSACLFGDITLKDGRVEQSNFHDYPTLRMQEAPQIEVEIVKSGEAPGGIGETATAAVGPAFANALYAATGKRLYQLPAKAELLAVKKAA